MSRGEVSEVGTQKKTQNGYTTVKTEDGWKYLHIIQAEAHLGRELEPGERVYFKDGNKDNLSNANLEVRHVGRKSRSRRSAMKELQIVRGLVNNLSTRLDELEKRFDVNGE